jgi:hypothetical protein
MKNSRDTTIKKQAQTTDTKRNFKAKDISMENKHIRKCLTLATG